MTVVGYGTIPIIPSMRGFQGMVDQHLNSIMPAAGDRAGRALGDSTTSGFRASLGSMAHVAGQMVAQVGVALGAGAVAAGTYGLKLAAANEQAEISFTTMLGSAQKAKVFLDDLRDFAAKTPFEFPELQQAASSLISAGVEASKVIPIMTTLGDVTAGMGTGSEGIKRATVALQQMQAAGKITGQDLNQLRDAGIPVYDLLAAATGKAKSEVSALAQAGKLGSTELAQLMSALESGKGLERFAGLMDKQSKSLSGLMSTLKDTIGQDLATAMEPAVGELKDMLPPITASAEALIHELAPAFGSTLGVAAKALPVVLHGLDTGLGLLHQYGPAFAALGAGLGSLGAPSLPFVGSFLPEINPVLAGLTALTLAVPAARQALTDVVTEAAPMAKELAAELLPVLGDLTDLAGTILPDALHLGGAALTDLLEVALPVARGVADLTGFLSDHAAAVEVVVGAYAAWKLAVAGGLALESLAILVTGLYSQFLLLGQAILGSGVIAGLAMIAEGFQVMAVDATTGSAAVAAGFAQMRAGASLVIGAIVSIQTALIVAAAGFIALNSGLDKAKRKGEEFADSLKPKGFDPNSVSSLQEYTKALGEGTAAAEEAASKDQNFWGSVKGGIQLISPLKDTVAEHGEKVIKTSEAYEKWNDALEALRSKYESTWELVHGRNLRVRSQDLGIEEIEGWINKLDLDPEKLGPHKLAKAINEARDAARVGTPDTEALAAAYKKLADNTSTSTEKIDAWKSTLDAAIGSKLNVFDATTAFDKALQSAKDSFSKNAWGTFDTGTAAGDANRDALSDTVSKAKALAEAYADQGKTKEASLILAEARQKIIDLGGAAGAGHDMIQSFVDQLGLTPELTKSQFELTGADTAQKKLEDLQAQLAALNNSQATIYVDAKTGKAPKTVLTPDQIIYLHAAGYSNDQIEALSNITTGKRWGGINVFDHGGIRDAMIGTGRGLTHWDEPETGGEAYIPRLGNLGRNEAIMRIAASWFGGEYVPAGATTGRPRPMAFRAEAPSAGGRRPKSLRPGRIGGADTYIENMHVTVQGGDPDAPMWGN